MNGGIEGVGDMWQQLPRMGGGRSRKVEEEGKGRCWKLPPGLWDGDVLFPSFLLAASFHWSHISF